MMTNVFKNRALLMSLAGILVAGAAILIIALLAGRTSDVSVTPQATNSTKALRELAGIEADKLKMLHRELQHETERMLQEGAREEQERRRKDFDELKRRINLSEQQTLEAWPVFAEEVPMPQGRDRLRKILTARQLKQYDEFVQELEERALSASPSELAGYLIRKLSIDPKKQDKMAEALAELEITSIARVDKWGDDYEGLLKEEASLSKKLLEPVLSKEEFGRYSVHVERETARKIARQRLLGETGE